MVLNIWAKPTEGHNDLGQIEDGAITLCGPAIALADLENLVLPRQASRELLLYWDQPDDEKRKDIAFVIFLTVSYYRHVDDAGGILIIPGKIEDTCVRVGTLSVRFKHYKLEPSEISIECQMFLEDRDRKTVMVV
jgi:hypothetical protein